MKKYLFLIITLTNLVSFSQTNSSVRDNWDFVFYLIGNNMTNEAMTLLDNLGTNNDSINFLRGYTYYSSKDFNKAIENFSLLTLNSNLYTESLFLSSYSNAILNNFEQSQIDLNKILTKDPKIINLKNFSLSAISLLRRDNESFDFYSNQVDSTDFLFSEEMKNLKSIKNDIDTYKSKSKLLAGGLSAIIPGLGKVYAGNTGEGISSFLICGSLMAVTAENWYRKGLTNWRTLLFGCISTVFYVGNIYGSIVSVKVNYENFYERNQLQILYNINIPLRNKFRH